PLSWACASPPSAPSTALDTLSLHDALPICRCRRGRGRPDDRGAQRPKARPVRRRAVADAGGVPRRDGGRAGGSAACLAYAEGGRDRKSTRLNSSHVSSSYAVFCLKKKTNSQ